MAVITQLDKQCVRCHESITLTDEDVKTGKVFSCPICGKKQRAVLEGFLNRRIVLRGILFG